MKILLADDELEIRRLYREMLEGNGHQVTVTQDGRETLEAIAKTEFDLVILDLYMPEVDGFEVLEEVRGGGNEVPIVLMTGHFPEDMVRERIWGLDVKEVLVKPVMITTLLNAVERLA